MASLIESIYFGDDSYPDQQNAIFVWLSDSPQLNEQSKQKIDLKADKIRLDQCVTITEETFDREVLDDGHIYFLNTQKLGKSSNLTKHSDTRQYTIWETLANTAREKSDRLYLIIDEAHRGMQGREASKATTIMQKFLKGSSEDKLAPMPVVIGMSATSERFNRLVEGTSSTIEPYPTPNFIEQDLNKILEAISFCDKIIFGRLNYNKKVSEYKDHKAYFNKLAEQVIAYCQTNGKQYHIKDGTIT